MPLAPGTTRTDLELDRFRETVRDVVADSHGIDRNAPRFACVRCNCEIDPGDPPCEDNGCPIVVPFDDELAVFENDR